MKRWPITTRLVVVLGFGAVILGALSLGAYIAGVVGVLAAVVVLTLCIAICIDISIRRDR